MPIMLLLQIALPFDQCDQMSMLNVYKSCPNMITQEQFWHLYKKLPKNVRDLGK